MAVGSAITTLKFRGGTIAVRIHKDGRHYIAQAMDEPDIPYYGKGFTQQAAKRNFTREMRVQHQILKGHSANLTTKRRLDALLGA